MTPREIIDMIEDRGIAMIPCGDYVKLVGPAVSNFKNLPLLAQIAVYHDDILRELTERRKPQHEVEVVLANTEAAVVRVLKEMGED